MNKESKRNMKALCEGIIDELDKKGSHLTVEEIYIRHFAKTYIREHSLSFIERLVEAVSNFSTSLEDVSFHVKPSPENHEPITVEDVRKERDRIKALFTDELMALYEKTGCIIDGCELNWVWTFSSEGPVDPKLTVNFEVKVH